MRELGLLHRKFDTTDWKTDYVVSLSSPKLIRCIWLAENLQYIIHIFIMKLT